MFDKRQSLLQKYSKRQFGVCSSSTYTFAARKGIESRVCRLDLKYPQTAGVTPVSETVAIPHFGLLFDSILLSCRINHSW